MAHCVGCGKTFIAKKKKLARANKRIFEAHTLCSLCKHKEYNKAWRDKVVI